MVLYHFNPTEHDFFPKCGFYQLTGYHCPGCGTTRAAHQFAHGNIVRGLAFNPLLILVIPLAAGLALERYSQWWRRKGFHLSAWISPWILWVVLGYWLARNIPYYPFTLLAPH